MFYEERVVAVVVMLLLTFNFYSDVDVTGITEFSVNDSTYHIAGDSVIITSDGDKYQDSDDSISDYQSSDEEEIVDR